MKDLQRRLLACQKMDERLATREQVKVSNRDGEIPATEDSAK